MTDFLSKKKQINHSLATRAAGICIIFLILPLLFHTLYLFVYDYQIKKRGLFAGLERAVKGQVRFVDELVEGQRNNLHILADLPEVGEGHRSSQMMGYWAKQLEWTTLAFAEFNHNDELVCAGSNIAAMQGKVLPYSFAVSKGKPSLFLATDPWTKTKQLIYSIPDENGFLISGMPADELISRKEVMAHKTYSLVVGLVGSGNRFFLAKGGRFANINPQDLPVADGDNIDIEKMKVIRNKKTYYEFSVPMEQEAFSLVFSVKQRFLDQISIREAFYRLLLPLIGLLLMGGALALLLMRRMSKPLLSLIETMDKVEEGNSHARYEHDKMGFEINLIGNQFNQTVGALIKQREQTEIERLRRELFEKELLIGKEIQSVIIPSKPPKVEGLEIATQFKPAKQLGGDFYDFLQDGALLNISIADAADKGISACLFSLDARSLMRGFSTDHVDVGAALTRSNSLFSKDTGDSGNFVTAWQGRLNPESGSLVYANAGHLPALIVRQDGSIDELSEKGAPLGIVESEVYFSNEALLNPGDLLFLYTDGVIEAHSANNELYSLERLHKFLKIYRDLPVDQIAEKLTEDIDGFSAGKKQHDDITFVLVRKV